MQQYITAAATRQQASTAIPTANISRQTAIATPEATPASASAEAATAYIFVSCGAVLFGLLDIIVYSY